MQKEESCARGHGAGGRDRETFKSEGQRARPIFLRALGWPVPPGTRGGGWKVTCLAPECQGHWLYQRGRAAAGNAPPSPRAGLRGARIQAWGALGLVEGTPALGKGPARLPQSPRLVSHPHPPRQRPCPEGTHLGAERSSGSVAPACQSHSRQATRVLSQQELD